MALGNDKATDTIPYPRQTDTLAQAPHHSNALHRLLITVMPFTGSSSQQCPSQATHPFCKAPHTSQTHIVGYFLPL